ncbi:hypothetical protein ABTY98_32960 [Streptomyces sp. NPDC096040]|uniref:hypothetical protein n=1 Tax=Streptomyces sp. NPDC096040 TaxID=3155541 RepID=UPI003317BE59
MRHPVRPVLAGILLAAALVLTGCSGDDSGASAGDARADTGGAVQEAAGSAGAKDSSGRGTDKAPTLTVNHIIRTASLDRPGAGRGPAVRGARGPCRVPVVAGRPPAPHGRR